MIRELTPVVAEPEAAAPQPSRKPAPKPGAERCPECKKPKRHAKWCSHRGETPYAAKPAQAHTGRGIPQEKVARIEQLGRGSNNIHEIVVDTGVSIPTIRRVLKRAGITLSGSRKRREDAPAETEDEEVPHIAETERSGLHPMDERRLLSKAQYSACKTAHFRGKVSAELLRINYPDQGVDEIKRALASQNYEEYAGQ